VLPTPKKNGIPSRDLVRPQAGGERMFKHLEDTVTYDERLHQADVTARFPAPLSTEIRSPKRPD
jgi:hypothetical protein